jgi:hypothetical protein
LILRDGVVEAVVAAVVCDVDLGPGWDHEHAGR